MPKCYSAILVKIKEAGAWCSVIQLSNCRTMTDKHLPLRLLHGYVFIYSPRLTWRLSNRMRPVAPSLGLDRSLKAVLFVIFSDSQHKFRWGKHWNQVPRWHRFSAKIEASHIWDLLAWAGYASSELCRSWTQLPTRHPDLHARTGENGIKCDQT